MSKPMTSLIRLDPAQPDERLLRDAFACYPSGVVALCGLVGGEPVGMVASSFACVSLKPPLVSVCIQHSSSTWPKLRQAGRIGVSCLAAGQSEACKQLAAKEGDRFAGLRWSVTAEGALLLHEAAALFECHLLRDVPAGDHDIVLLQVHSVQMHPGRDPLVFHGRTFRAFEARDDAAV